MAETARQFVASPGRTKARSFLTICGVIIFNLTACHSALASAPKSGVSVVVGNAPHPLERFAAQELCVYLKRLFGIKVQPTATVPPENQYVFLVGTSGIRPLAAIALKHAPLPTLSPQGVAILPGQLEGTQALLITGGSPKAVMWAVYDLAERWGVRYLLHGDIIPRPRKWTPFESTVIREPILPVRQWRVVNELPIGPISWGLRDYRKVIDQLAKLRFNRLLVVIWPHQPFLHYEYKGVARRSATIFFGNKFPITKDTVGRKLFGGEKQFWNPDLPTDGGYRALTEAGVQHVRSILEYGRSRGMEIVFSLSVTEFPPEFADVLGSVSTVRQVNQLTIGPGPNVGPSDRRLIGLASTVLRSAVNTYPDVDYIQLAMPEWRHSLSSYEEAWQYLNSRFSLDQVSTLGALLEHARDRERYPGGAERAVNEVKGDLVSLTLFDRILSVALSPNASGQPNFRIIYSNIAEELSPFLPLMMPLNGEVLSFIDYTPSRILRRKDALDLSEGKGHLGHVLIYTLHDDNVGLLPQLATHSLHELTREIIDRGWNGFSTRYWLIGDHDPSVAYISQAAWDKSVTPESVYRQQIISSCGNRTLPDLLAVFREVEAATLNLELHGLGLALPVPDMMMKHWIPAPMPEYLIQSRMGYRNALAAALRASSSSKKCGYAQYWVGRLRFGIYYIDTIELLRLAAIAEKNGALKEARAYTKRALQRSRRSIKSYASVARDRSDIGAIAVLNQYVYLPLMSKLSEMQRRRVSPLTAERSSRFNHIEPQPLMPTYSKVTGNH